MTYDTEGTLNPGARFTSLAQAYPELAAIDWENDEQYMFTDLSRYTGDEWFKISRGASCRTQNTRYIGYSSHT
ncbi:hypothetical protein ACLBPJ_29635, partial [Klebsiella pneumoniae]